MPRDHLNVSTSVTWHISAGFMPQAWPSVPQAWSFRRQAGVVLHATGVMLPATGMVPCVTSVVLHAIDFGLGCSLKGSVGSALTVPVLVVLASSLRVVLMLRGLLLRAPQAGCIFKLGLFRVQENGQTMHCIWTPISDLRAL